MQKTSLNVINDDVNFDLKALSTTIKLFCHNPVFRSRDRLIKKRRIVNLKMALKKANI